MADNKTRQNGNMVSGETAIIFTDVTSGRISVGSTVFTHDDTKLEVTGRMDCDSSFINGNQSATQLDAIAFAIALG